MRLFLKVILMNKMTLNEYITNHLGKIISETLYLVGISALIAIIIGMIIGSVLYITRRGKSKVSKVIYKILDVCVNILRSFPFIILIFFLVPFTRAIMKVLTGIGTSSGNTACLIPLAVAAAPFFAKIIENALIEVDENVVEAANSLGLNPFQVMVRVVIREALPAIISGVTLAIITLVGFSAMAGYVGAGGIGNFALIYGVNNYDTNAIIYAVITIILFVQVIQLIGNFIYKLVK